MDSLCERYDFKGHGTLETPYIENIKLTVVNSLLPIVLPLLCFSTTNKMQ